MPNIPPYVMPAGSWRGLFLGIAIFGAQNDRLRFKMHHFKFIPAINAVHYRGPTPYSSIWFSSNQGENIPAEFIRQFDLLLFARLRIETMSLDYTYSYLNHVSDVKIFENRLPDPDSNNEQVKW